MIEKDQVFMELALEMAKKAEKKDEVPVGAVVVKEGQVIAKAHNRRETSHNPCGHAEILAIEKAAKKLGSWRLCDCTLYVTLEPCPMCTGALINARVKRVVYGAKDPKSGALGSLVDLNAIGLNHKLEVKSRVLEKACGDILTKYFVAKRKGGNEP